MDDLNRLIQLELHAFSRRLRGMAMISRGIVPNLIISQRVVERVLAAARSYLEDETGETMVGLVVDTDEPEQMPTLYVLDTIAPDDSTIRRTHMFEQGDVFQEDIYNWQLDNWNAYREIGKDMNGLPIRQEWDVPLSHLGDWHKQPGYMIQPSGGDLMTALRIMDDEENNFEFLLVPIVTLGHPTVTSEEGASVNYFTVPLDDGTSLRMDWWYIHRDVRIFQPITPVIMPKNEMPALTPYPWHILDIERMDNELRLLENDGLILIGQTALLWETDGDLPLEICFMVARPGTTEVFIMITDWDYPRSKPRVRVAPFTGIDPSMFIYDVFEQLWQNSSPANLTDFDWKPGKSLAEYIAAIEIARGTRPTGQASPVLSDNPDTGHDAETHDDGVDVRVSVQSSQISEPDSKHHEKSGVVNIPVDTGRKPAKPSDNNSDRQPEDATETTEEETQ